MSWLRLHRPAAARHATAEGLVVGDAERRACIRQLVLMLMADRLSEDEFDVRWKTALEARTHAELNALRCDPERGGSQGEEDPDGGDTADGA